MTTSIDPCFGPCDVVLGKAADTAGSAVSSAAGGALDEAATQMKQAVGEAVGSIGSMWVNVKSPTLKGGDAEGAPTVQPGETAGGVAESGVLTFLQYAAYISLGVCVLALIIVGTRMAIETRRQDAEFHMTRVMTVLIAAILISGAAAIATAVMPTRSTGGSTVAFLENSLWYYTAAAVVMSVIIGGLRMAWEQRADAGKDLLQSLLTFIVVSGAGLTVISLLIAAGDAYSSWILDKSLECSVEENTKCFGENMTILLGMSAASGGIGVIAVLILGLMAFIASMVQVGLMIARSGMLIVLAGALPLSASATNTAMGKQMFQRTTAWIIALVLYKPAAAIIYAAAFQLAGSDVLGGGADAIVGVVIGLVMMFLALVTLPAMMKLLFAGVGAIAAGNAAGSMAMAAGAAVPAGAISAGKLMGGGPGGGGPSGGGSDSGPSGSNDSAGAGGPSAGGSSGGGPSGPNSSGGSGGGPSGGDSGSASGMSEAGAAAGSGAAAGGAAAAGGGPVGAAASAGQQAAGAAREIGEDAMGEGDDPNGSS